MCMYVCIYIYIYVWMDPPPLRYLPFSWFFSPLRRGGARLLQGLGTVCCCPCCCLCFCCHRLYTRLLCVLCLYTVHPLVVIVACIAAVTDSLKDYSAAYVYVQTVKPSMCAVLKQYDRGQSTCLRKCLGHESSPNASRVLKFNPRD